MDNNMILNPDESIAEKALDFAKETAKFLDSAGAKAVLKSVGIAFGMYLISKL